MLHILRFDLQVRPEEMHGFLQELAGLPSQDNFDDARASNMSCWLSLDEFDSLLSNAVAERFEPAALIDPRDAAVIVENKRALHAERFLQSIPEARTSTRKPVALLTFSRASMELHDALLTSSVARTARSQGVDLRPAWATGRLIFVEGVGASDLEDLGSDGWTGDAGNNPKMQRQVILCAEDIEGLLDELRAKGLPNNLRKIKPNPRLLPEEHSLMQCTETETLSLMLPSSASSCTEVAIEATGWSWSLHVPRCDTRHVSSEPTLPTMQQLEWDIASEAGDDPVGVAALPLNFSWAEMTS